LVRGTAVWALGRLLPRERLASIAAAHRPQERDAAVCDEWTAALAPPAH
jgi:epoxyqueuosine reductase